MADAGAPPSASAVAPKKQKTDGKNTSSSTTAKVTTTTHTPTKKKNPKKNNKRKRNAAAAKAAAPKPGEEGYLTATQLRNARKRRAKKKRKGPDSVSDDNNNNNNKQDGDQTGRAVGTGPSAPEARSAGGVNVEDPSMRYIHNPRSAPIVRSATQYFSDLKQPDEQQPIKPLKVYLGPTEHWRTVAKLAVRNDPQSGSDDKKKVTIGLFLPKTHTVIPVPDCIAHHPSINYAVEAATKACEKVGVEPYDETTGGGYLRYVAINVERSSGKVQMTLVWNSAPYADDEDDGDNPSKEEGGNDEEEDGGRSMLHRLVKELIRVGGSESDESFAADGSPTTTAATATKRKRRRGRNSSAKEQKGGRSEDGPSSSGRYKLHSLWVHHNAAWKHSNAIFDCTAADDSSAAGGGSSTWKRFHGPAAIVESLGIQSYDDGAAAVPPQPSAVKLHFPPNVFRQANIDKFADIVSTIRKRVARYTKERRGENRQGGGDNDETVTLPSCVELYGGVGTIGLNVVDLMSTLVSSDENPHNAQCFRDSAAALHDSVKGRATYVAKNATDMVKEEGLFLREGGSQTQAAEVVIVDPPRKGLDATVREALTTSLPNNSDEGPQMLIYVSCGFNAFKRDCDELLRSGRWSMDHAEGHLLFPGSDAIETLSFFVRKS